MKVSKQTFEIIKNFSTISSQMLFVPGKVQTIISKEGKSTVIFAKATLDTEIEKQFGIFDLHKFFSVVSLLDEPNIEITDTNLIISEGAKTVYYQLTNPDFIKFEEKPDRFDNMKADYEFVLKQADFQNIMKLYAVLSFAYLTLQGDGEKVYLATDAGNQFGNSAKIEIGETDKTFKATLKGEYIRMLNKNYQVLISAKGAVKFIGDNIEYIIPVERKLSEL